MQTTTRINPQELNMYIETYVTINKMNIPIYIHIKDIFPYEEYSDDNKIDIIGEDMRVDKTDSPFKEYYERNKRINKVRYYLQFIDSRPIFDGKTWIEHKIPNYRDDMLLNMTELGMSQQMYIKFINEVNYYIQHLKNKCIKKIKEVLDFDRDFPKITLKKKSGMEQYSEYLSYSSAMSLLQTAFEYTDSILFPENKGKSFFEYSFREIHLKVMYISMKNKIEGMTNKIQSKLMEKDD